MNEQQAPPLDEGTRQLASYIAMVIRNAMEDFHGEHLSDDQMNEVVALHAATHCSFALNRRANEPR